MATRVGDVYLRHGPDIYAVPVMDAAGTPVGTVFGFPTYLPHKKVMRGTYQLDETLGADVDAFVEKVLTSVVGRFLWVFTHQDIARIYLDCAGLVSCVYDPALQVAASTAHAMLNDDQYDARFDASLYDRLRVRREGWFPAGLTAHKGVSRLLPNHYLDLQRFEVHRHWPNAPVPRTDSPQDAIAELIEIVRDQIEALIGAEKKVAMALTAGHETRMLLGIVRPLLSDIEHVTVTGADRHSVDTMMARRIAKAEGLRHMELPRRTASEAARDLYIRRGGHCVTDSNSYYAPSVHPIAPTHNFVGGLGGEVARAFLWQDADRPDTDMPATRLIGRFGLPNETELREPLEAWLKTVPSDSTLDVLDLAYIEHRMGPWSGGQFYNDPTLVRYAPMFTRRTTELMLSLPDDWKRGQWMSGEALRQTWPELSKYPYNSAGKLRDTFAKVQRVIDDPGIVVRKLRKMRN